MLTDHVWKYTCGFNLKVVIYIKFDGTSAVRQICEKILLVFATRLGPVIPARGLRQETRVFHCRPAVYTGASDMSLLTTNTTIAKHKQCPTCKEVHRDPGEDS